MTSEPMFAEPLKSHIELGRNLVVLMGLWALTSAGWGFVPDFVPYWLKVAALGSFAAFLTWLTFGLLFAAHKPFYGWVEVCFSHGSMPRKTAAIAGIMVFWLAVFGACLLVVGAIYLGLAI